MATIDPGTHVESIVDQVVTDTRDHIEVIQDVLHVVMDIRLCMIRPYLLSVQQTEHTYQVYFRLVAHISLYLRVGIDSFIHRRHAIHIIAPQAVDNGLDGL